MSETVVEELWPSVQLGDLRFTPGLHFRVVERVRYKADCLFCPQSFAGKVG